MLLKRSLSLLLCALLALSLCAALPRTAKAAPPTGVWVGGIELADGAYYLNDGAGGLTTEGANSGNYNVRYSGGTLTLKDALITKNISWEHNSYNRTAAVYTSGSLRIMLEGRSQLCGADITDSFPASYGVCCKGDLFIQGDGSLTAIGGMADYSYGLNCTGTLTFGGSGSVIATGGTATGISYGVLGARITVSDGTLTATGGTATSSSYGVYSSGSNPGSITVSGGTLIATGGTATDASGRSYGVFCNNGVDIAGGLTVARSGVAQDAARSQAINVTPSGLAPLTGGLSETFAVYGDARTYAVIDRSHPIQLEGGGTANWLDYTGTYKPVDSSAHFTWDGSTLTLTNVIINSAQFSAITLPSDATLTLHGASVVKGFDDTSGIAMDSVGIRGEGDLTVNGNGSLIAIGGTVTNAESYGVYAGALTLNSGSSLIAIGGTTTNSANNSYGISGSSVTLAGGNLTAIGGTAADSSYGTRGNTVTVNDGALTAIGGTAADSSYGARGNTVTVDDGALTAIGGTSNNNNFGVYGEASITISDGAVTAMGSTSKNRGSNGMSAGGNLSVITIRGGVITAMGGTSAAAGGESNGMFSSASITIENGAVTAMGGTAYNSRGAYSRNVTVSGGTATATGGAASNSVGVRGDDSITLTGGTTTATGGSSALSMQPAFSDAQHADTWYMWKINPADTYRRSSDAQYAYYATHTYLKVTPAVSAPVITTTTLPNGTVGLFYSQTLQATGDAPITWSIDTGSLPAGLTLNAATGEITGTPTAADTISFTVKATNAAGSNTQELTLAVSDAPVPPAAPTITTQPAPQRITMGNAATFSVIASGNPAPTYQWQVSTDDGATWRNVENGTGGTTASYTTPGTTASMDGYQYRCVVTNSEGDAISSAATLTVSDAPVPPAPASPGGSSSIAGGGAYTGNQYPGSFAMGANGGPVLTVQAPCDKCVSVSVDNVQLKKDADYITECGSTIVTFTPSYLATLKNGTHSIRVQFTDGRYDGNFITPFAASLAAAPMADVPATGDTPPLARLIEWLRPHAAMRNE